MSAALQNLNTAVSKLWWRMMYVIGRGRVTLVNDVGNVQKMQVQFGLEEISDNVPRLAEFGFTSNPPAGSDVIAVSLMGDRSNTVVIATGNQQFRFNTATGEAAMYDAFGKSIHLKNGEIDINANGSPVNVNNSTTVTINASTDVIMNTPLLKVSGDIIDNFATQTHTMAQMRSIYNTHTHGGVQGGSSHTAVPDQTE